MPKPAKPKHSSTVDFLKNTYKYNTKYEAMNTLERTVDIILHTSLTNDQIRDLAGRSVI